jgi:hypothetical protein
MKANPMIFIIDTLDRDSYVAARAQFKDQYKALSEEIRTRKIAIKNAMRSGGYAGHDQNRLRSDQFIATDMLANLAEAKAKLKALTAEVACAA